MIEVSGPDTLTSCGEAGRVLQLGVEYVAGIGGRCSPIRSWAELSTYSANELEQLQEMDCGALLPSIALPLLAYSYHFYFIHLTMFLFVYL